MNLGATELIIILAVVLLLFGSTRLPKLARPSGRPARSSRRASTRRPKDEGESKSKSA